MTEKTLSIVIPTYNRGNVIGYTLSLFRDQILRNSDEVELIVCNNASTDDTEDVLNALLEEEKWFSYVNYSEHVDIDDSTRRAVENASGKFIHLFGDDDVPAPFMVDTVICLLHRNPDIGLLTLNAMHGVSDASLTLRNLYVKIESFDQNEHLYADSKSYAETYFGHMGFMSVNVINSEVWKKGLQNYSSEHRGYAFLMVILSGAVGYNCIFYQYPLCIQRAVLKGGNGHAFSNTELGVYQFIGIPRVLKRLEEVGAITNWRQSYNNYVHNNDKGFYNFIFGASENANEYSKYYDDIICYQSDKQRILNAKKLFLSVGTPKYPCVKVLLKIKIGGMRYIMSLPLKLIRKIRQ